MTNPMNWIPIAEAKLVDEEIYLVITDDHFPFAAKYDKANSRFAITFEGIGCAVLEKNNATHVIAWKDVPKPEKETL